MQKINQDEIWRKKVDSQLFQIKVMLIILIGLCLLGFYALSTVMDALGDVFKVLFGVGVFIVLVYLIVEVSNVLVPPKTQQRIDKKLEKIIDKARSEQKDMER